MVVIKAAAVAVALLPVGQWFGIAECFRAPALQQHLTEEGLVQAGQFASAAGELFDLWTDGRGRFVVTMTGPQLRGAVCVIADGDRGPEL